MAMTAYTMVRAPKKGQFGNLRGLELAVGIPELDGSLPFLDRVAGGENAVEAGVGDFIVDLPWGH